MSYRHVDPDALTPDSDHPCDRRSISEAVGLGVLHAAVYRLDPGESLARTYHYHKHREEIFFVLSGTLQVETPDREFTVPSGDCFVAEPESPLRPHNPSDASEPVRVFGAGAPLTDPGIPYERGESVP